MTSSDPSVQLDHTPGHIKHDGHNLTGFVIFLCSESIIFLAFFAGFSLFKLTSPEWLPAGVDGLEVKMPLINTIVLVSSSLWLISLSDTCTKAISGVSELSGSSPC